MTQQALTNGHEQRFDHQQRIKVILQGIGVFIKMLEELPAEENSYH
jgi:hypothetical protein